MYYVQFVMGGARFRLDWIRFDSLRFQKEIPHRELIQIKQKKYGAFNGNTHTHTEKTCNQTIRIALMVNSVFLFWNKRFVSMFALSLAPSLLSLSSSSFLLFISLLQFYDAKHQCVLHQCSCCISSTHHILSNRQFQKFANFT